MPVHLIAWHPGRFLQPVRRFVQAALAGVVLASLVAVAGCELPIPDEGQGQGQQAPQGEGEGEGPGHRFQRLGLTPQEELAVGKKAYREILEEYRGRILPADSREVQRARQVTARIVKAAGIEPLQREINLHLDGYVFQWEVNVLEDDQINAFCLPGGKIGVFTGLFQVVGNNDDQLATVLSHEIAHALAHHSSERVAEAKNEPPGGSIARYFQHKKFDRAQEAEADKIGVFLMTFAGYDPRQAIVFWQRMEQMAPTHMPEILSDHPSHEHRIEAMEDNVRRALAAKRAFDEGRIAPAPGRRQ
jgi:metalloendopeptidase OMA1, mitochondrial